MNHAQEKEIVLVKSNVNGNGNGNKYPSWQWMAGIFLLFIMALIGILYDQLYSKVDAAMGNINLNDHRITVLETNYANIQDTLNKINQKLDRLR